MSEDQRKRRDWERQFPPLDAEWTHWWIEGDGALLAVVGVADLSAALDVVARHHTHVFCIYAHAAKVDSFGEVVRDENHRHMITDPTAPSDNIEAPSDGQCCFCARPLVSVSDVIALVQRPSGGPTLRCHDECLRSLLR
jgi:hypothetical protein